MNMRLWASVMTVVLLAVPHIADAQRAPDARVADLVRAGKVRIALFAGQYTFFNSALNKSRGVRRG